MKQPYNLFKVLFSVILLIVFLSVPMFSVFVSPGASDENNINPKKAPYRVPTATSKIKIDGKIDEDAWKNALVLELKYEIDPGENIPAPVKTELLILASSSHIYVAFRAYDSNPSEIRARFTDRDTIWNDDYVGIVLDTFNDSRRASQFLCNPFGIQADQGIASEGYQPQWDAIWNSAGRITNEGYFVEMAIPYTSLRFQRIKGDQVWGIDAIRSYPRGLTHSLSLFPIDRSNNCYLCQAEKVIGFSNAKPGNNIELDPTLTGVLTQARPNFPDGKYVDLTKKVDVGLSARWSVTPNMALNATINPDFSQVEADVLQMDINTPFALYYPEKRPFFMEGLPFFQTTFDAVYTRSIKDPEWGIKLTGREGKHTIGWFTVKDKETTLMFPSSQNTYLGTIKKSNISSAFRYRYDIGRSSALGLIITDREGEHYSNRLFAADGDIRFNPKHSASFQILTSQTRYPDNVTLKYRQPDGYFWGSALFASYIYSTRELYFSGKYNDVSSKFRADLGFTGQADYRNGSVTFYYKFQRNPGHWFTRINLGGKYIYYGDHHENLIEKHFVALVKYLGPLQSYVVANMNIGKEAYMSRIFRDNNLVFESEFRPSGNLAVAFLFTGGDGIDYSNVRAGKRLNFNPIFTYNFGRHFVIQFNHFWERLTVDAGHLYTANLSNVLFLYQFTSRAFLRTVLQYANYKYSPEHYSFPVGAREKGLFTQILFSYKINPQTVLFLGYSDNYYGNQMINLKRTDRTFFMKIGYALVM